jgi:hypothetical protein
VADRTDRRAHHDPAPRIQQRDGAGRGGAASCGAGGAAPLPGVEHHGRGRGPAGHAGIDAADAPRPQDSGQGQASGEG